MIQVEVDAAELGDVWRLERSHKAKLLYAEVWPDGHAIAELQPVADVSWYIDVWNRVARLMLVRDDGCQVCASHELKIDDELLDKLITQVIYQDHHSDRNISRVYYPLSQESVELFQHLMTRAKRIEDRG
jgi:hypothetical protein